MKLNMDSIEAIKREEQEKLTQTLREAAKAYYSGTKELMSNFEYDELYSTLEELEEATGIVFAGSPTAYVGYEVSGKLQKEEHEYPALSLSKTKSRSEYQAWLSSKVGVLSAKLDGMTLIGTYNDGKLAKISTRGNGLIGQQLKSDLFLHGLPQRIPCKGHLVVRGEALITYPEFERINAAISEEEGKYKNPRNLASGTILQQDAKIFAERQVEFVGFNLVYPQQEIFSEGLNFLSQNGFQVVEHVLVTAATLQDEISKMEARLSSNVFPSDGLVLIYEDVQYGNSLTSSSKCAANGYALKWEDETAVTVLREVEWSASRTGLLNPVAIFDPVELEGTTISRASVHNLSVIRQLRLGIGDYISVYKANMIIPQIGEDYDLSDTVQAPAVCPVCGSQTLIKHRNSTDTVHCTGNTCPAKQIGNFVHFVGRDAMDINGMSEATLERLVDIGFIKTLVDIYELARYQTQICAMEGFGEKSYQKMIDAIEASRTVKFEKFLYALGIGNVGRDASKKISKYCGGSIDVFTKHLQMCESFAHLEGIGSVIDTSICDWKEKLNADLAARDSYMNLVEKMRFEEPAKINADNAVSGKTFVITGSLTNFSNRDALVAHIESLGGKVSSSISAKTSYLINNDLLSASTKNKAAQSLKIPILTEDMYLAFANE